MAVAVVDLTTLALVNSHAGLDGTDDVLMQELITSVSTQFEGAVKRTLAQVEAVNTIYRAPASSAVIILDEWPNATPVVTENDTALTVDVDYEILDQRRLVRISGIADIAWASRGKIDVTVHEGYATVPEDLALACREQTLFAFKQAGAGSKRLGVASKTSPTAGDESFVAYDFLDIVVRTLQRYKRDLA